MGGFSMSNRRSFLKQAAMVGGAFSMGAIPKELFASEEILKLTILHTNDLHCHFDPFPESDAEYAGRGGLVRLASVVEQCRTENPNLLLLDAGDMFQGTPYFNYFKGDLILKVMSRMGYDAGTIGNHEFDNGLDDILSALKYAKFPLVSSNYDFSETVLADKVKTFQILNKGGVKIGIYGLGIQLDGLVNKSNYGNTRYLDPLKSALEMESLLKNEHACDLVICLSHLGFSYDNGKISDKTLAAQTRFTDLIIGGHTHTFLEKPFVTKNAEGKTIVINQVGWAALSIGKIEFVLDRNRKSDSPVIVLNNL